jgi:hypothetical protein
MFFFIWGFTRRFTVLGIKIDECAACGQVCQHVVGRKTRWFTLFFVPLVFLGWSHGMASSACGAWSGIPFRTMRAAMRSGVLLLDRPRPNTPGALAAAAGPDQPPLHQGHVVDSLHVNPKRGPWDLYVKVWPALVALGIVGVVVSPKAPPPPAAHQCWVATDGGIMGCRLANGTIRGAADGTPITCYFDEPLPATSETLSCDK